MKNIAFKEQFVLYRTKCCRHAEAKPMRPVTVLDDVDASCRGEAEASSHCFG